MDSMTKYNYKVIWPMNIVLIKIYSEAFNKSNLNQATVK